MPPATHNSPPPPLPSADFTFAYDVTLAGAHVGGGRYGVAGSHATSTPRHDGAPRLSMMPPPFASPLAYDEDDDEEEEMAVAGAKKRMSAPEAKAPRVARDRTPFPPAPIRASTMGADGNRPPSLPQRFKDIWNLGGSGDGVASNNAGVGGGGRPTTATITSTFVKPAPISLEVGEHTNIFLLG